MDERSLLEKLRAMANQSASPHEAKVARSLLERLAGLPANLESPRALTREQILSRPDRSASSRTVSVVVGGRRWVLDEDEAALVEDLASWT